MLRKLGTRTLKGADMTDEKQGMTYAASGVNYEQMDPFKVTCQQEARTTSHHMERFGFKEVEASRGESAYLIEAPWGYLAHVEEGLGTKNLVADVHDEDISYAYMAQDTVAMIVNDMITVGALPLSVQMHVAAGRSGWFSTRHSDALIRGWRNACHLARCTWGGGETPTLAGIVNPDTVVLSGSATGVIMDKRHYLQERIAPGDRIILINSSGIHANGLTLARKIASRLPRGYNTRLLDRRTYGEHLLTPTDIYVRIMERLQKSDVEIHYAVNITGHGWRKLMRPRRPFAYIIEHLPEQPLIFDFIQKHGPVSDEEAYGNFNMGAGFALYVPPSEVRGVWSVLESFRGKGPCVAVDAGYIEAAEHARVEIRPKNITFTADTLNVR